MKISELKCNHETESARLKKVLLQFKELLKELRERLLPEEIIKQINQDIEELNAFSSSEKSIRKLVKKKQAKIMKLLEKELKLVTKNHYRNQWMAIGMAIFGVPIGTSMGMGFNNMSFIGVGIPIGLAIGIGIGTDLDKKALKEGRQLNIEIEI